jgi:hypothetical protein
MGPIARCRSKPLPLGSRSCRSRVIRAYRTPEGRLLLVVAEADRSTTPGTSIYLNVTVEQKP